MRTLGNPGFWSLRRGFRDGYAYRLPSCQASKPLHPAMKNIDASKPRNGESGPRLTIPRHGHDGFSRPGMFWLSALLTPNHATWDSRTARA